MLLGIEKLLQICEDEQACNVDLEILYILIISGLGSCGWCETRFLVHHATFGSQLLAMNGIMDYEGTPIMPLLRIPSHQGVKSFSPLFSFLFFFFVSLKGPKMHWGAPSSRSNSPPSPIWIIEILIIHPLIANKWNYGTILNRYNIYESFMPILRGVIWLVKVTEAAVSSQWTSTKDIFTFCLEKTLHSTSKNIHSNIVHQYMAPIVTPDKEIDVFLNFK